ncbi:MAG: excinuclease ABC subunit UvrC, partial [Dehalococcoidia bacterium]|nr:excinuclease ABC subunit UvrC [Dehalococcoidia bacterium]
MMKNYKGKIIYVGKAKNLRKRVKSYFRTSDSPQHTKTNQLVKNITKIDYLITENESEALILEASLIREKKPKYNIRLKDDKNFPYLKINLNEQWPKVSITRNIDDDGCRYFGPFTSPGSARKNLEILNKLFPWRSCTKKITGKDERPCLDYFINRCIAPCTSFCTKDEYDQVIEQTIQFMEGKTDYVTTSLKIAMENASKNLEYEKAGKIRDQIKSIKMLENHQSTVSSTINLEADAIAIVQENNQIQYNVLHFRGNRIISADGNQIFDELNKNDDEIINYFILQYYSKKNPPPKNIFINISLKNKTTIELYLSKISDKKILISKPIKGFKKRLIDLSIENAKEGLLKKIITDDYSPTNIQQGLKIIMDELQLSNLPKRIECYDISHIQGSDMVGSMVVFENGLPKKSEYRRFKIKSLQSQDDYLAIKEIFSRRLLRLEDQVKKDKDSWKKKPDLVVIDGGKGQLNAAIEILLETGIKDITICGLAKRNEDIYVADLDEPISLKHGTPGLTLMQRIRDEAHRFAITYHRKLRSKRQIKSILDNIDGIGKFKKELLLKNFSSLEKLKKASKEELAAINGISPSLASKIKQSI